MSKNTPFCEISVLKGQKIIWTINLNRENKENENKILSNEDDKVENLMQLATQYIQQISKNVDEIKMDSYNAKVIKSIRKMVKKLLKMKNMRLSELSHEVNFFFPI